MRLRVFTLILLSTLALAATPALAQTLNLAQMRTDFLRITGLREGLTEKIDGEAECMEGTLSILEIESRSSLTLMMGARPLITGLGTGTTTEQEQGCDVVRTVSYGPGQVRFKRTLCAAGDTHEFNILLTVTNQGFQYVQRNKTNGVMTVNRTCRYRFVTTTAN